MGLVLLQVCGFIGGVAVIGLIILMDRSEGYRHRRAKGTRVGPPPQGGGPFTGG